MGKALIVIITSSQPCSFTDILESCNTTEWTDTLSTPWTHWAPCITCINRRRNKRSTRLITGRPFTRSPSRRDWLVSAFPLSLSHITQTFIVIVQWIKYAVSFLFQRLYISRYHTRGSLRLSTSQTTSQSYRFHGPAAGGFGEDVSENALSRCCDARAPGHVHQPTWGTCAGKKLISPLNWSLKV